MKTYEIIAIVTVSALILMEIGIILWIDVIRWKIYNRRIEKANKRIEEEKVMIRVVRDV